MKPFNLHKFVFEQAKTLNPASWFGIGIMSSVFVFSNIGWMVFVGNFMVLFFAFYAILVTITTKNE